MFRKLFVLGLAVAVVVGVGPAFAAKPATAPGLNGDLPDQAGVYDVPGHSNLKLKVIVHHGRPDNPGNGNGNGKGKETPPPEEVCNLPDPDSSAVTPAGGWALPADWDYELNANSAPDLVGADNAVEIAANSFAPWEGAVGSAVNLTYAGTTNRNKAQFDNHNVVTWGRAQGTALAVTYIWYNISTTPYTVVELDTVMNKKFSWAWSDPATWAEKTSAGTTCAFEGVYDAQAIMTHELGHWFGSDDAYTSVYVNNTMYGSAAKTESKKSTLTIGDIQGVQAIY
jgi:hypothetical protein